MTVSQQSLDGIRAWMNEAFKPAKTKLQEEGRPSVYRFQVEQGAPSPTLWISQDVFEHHPVDEIIAALNHDHVAAKLRRDPITPLISVEPQGRIISCRVTVGGVHNRNEKPDAESVRGLTR